MTRVDEMLEPPVVGQFYLVPGVTHIFKATPGWFPIIGLKHEDAEHLNFPHQHYHPDWRFMPDWAWNSATWLGEQAAFGLPLSHKPTDGSGDDLAPFGPVIYKRRKCRREPPVNTIFTTKSGGRSLHKAWLGKDARRGAHGLVCPHRGTVLGSVPVNDDGTITCPLHGLKFCASTGKSVPTHEPRQ